VALPLKARKDSSIEYTSCSGEKPDRMRITRPLMSAYRASLDDSAIRPCGFTRCRHWNQGWIILMPSALASAERATTQPSLLDSTTSGLPARPGLNTRSQLA